MFKILQTVQTVLGILFTTVNLVELVGTGDTLSGPEKHAKVLEQIKTVYKQVSGQELPAWIPEALLNFAIEAAVGFFNKTGWFTKGTVGSSTVPAGGLENAAQK